MEGLYLLFALSSAMFFGSYLAGSIPLAFSMSEGRIRLVSIFGAGLLVGTALSVIIPEGVESLYGAQSDLHRAAYHSGEGVGVPGRNVADGGNPPRDSLPAVNNPQDAAHGNFNGERKKREESSPVTRKLLQIFPLLQGPSGQTEAHGGVADGKGHSHSHAHAEGDELDVHSNGIHKAIGFSLVIGFIFMLVIDQATRSASAKGGERPRFKMTATIGLVVHAAADGVALGSASATNRTDVQFIVFIAIMLHKAPAAFGLVSFLLLEGLERWRIRRHLLVFALAAPVTALVTFYSIVAVRFFSFSDLLAIIGSQSLSSGSSTGILMLFSAGTFLYVATVHVLPELVNASDGYQLVGTASGAMGHSHSGSGPSFTVKELLAIIVGAVSPAVIASGHSHSH